MTSPRSPAGPNRTDGPRFTGRSTLQRRELRAMASRSSLAPPKVAAVLGEWRRAERLGESLPSTAPEHDTAIRLSSELRDLYAALTAGEREASRDVATSQRTIRRARRVLDAMTVRSRRPG